MEKIENLPKRAATIMLERILARMEAGCDLNEAEAQFLMAAYKTQSQEERSMADQNKKFSKVESGDLHDYLKVLRNGKRGSD